MQRGQSETGRSLVEMLGVIVMMGILSIGAVVGFYYAMNKHRSYEIISGVYQRALVASQKYDWGGSPNLSEFEKTINGYPTELISQWGNSHFFAIRVFKIPRAVCHHILQTHWAQPRDMFPNEGRGSTCDEDENFFTFVFENTLSSTAIPPTRCQGDMDCVSGCDKCVDGFCRESCPSGYKCGYNARGGSFYGKQKTCCAAGYYADGRCCDKVQNGLCCTSRVNVWTCCPPGYMEANQQCTRCDSPNVFRYNEHFARLCRACPNRVLAGTSCHLSCPTGTVPDGQGRCLCPPDKPLQDDMGRCYACSAGVIAFSNSNIRVECEKYCGDTHFFSPVHENYCCPRDFSKIDQSSCPRCGGVWIDNICQIQN